MKTIKFISKISLIAFALFAIVACDDDDDNTITETPTISDLAIATPALSSLVAALERADLVDALDDRSASYTVFAPTNAAFTAFLEANDFANLNAVPVPVLTQVLLNHVVDGKNVSGDLSTGFVNTLATFNDTDLNLSMFINTASGVRINGVSSVETATSDINAANGVIHVVDAVIGLPTVVTFATADPTFSTLVTALTTLTPNTNFVETLSGSGPFTVFAPTNAAFTALGTPPAEATLTKVLLHHVVSGNVQSGDLTPNGNTSPESLQGDSLIITLPGTGGNIANITDGAGNTDIGIVAVNVQASNGVIHAINKVLIPGEEL